MEAVDVLKKLGIDVVADLPVGENLQDHLFTSMWWKTTNAAPSPLTLTMSAATAKAGLKVCGCMCERARVRACALAHLALVVKGPATLRGWFRARSAIQPQPRLPERCQAHQT